MRWIRSAVAAVLILLAAPSAPVGAAADDGGTATLTLLATFFGTPIEMEAPDDEPVPLGQTLVLVAAGPVTLSGPSGTTGSLPSGTYALDYLSTSEGLYYDLAEIVCTNAPSAVSAVTLAAGENVTCTFEYDGLALSAHLTPPGTAPPGSASGPSRPAGLPVTGPETTVPAIVGAALVLLGGGLLLVSRRRSEPGTVSGSR